MNRPPGAVPAVLLFYNIFIILGGSLHIPPISLVCVPSLTSSIGLRFMPILIGFFNRYTKYSETWHLPVESLKYTISVLLFSAWLYKGLKYLGKITSVCQWLSIIRLVSIFSLGAKWKVFQIAIIGYLGSRLLLKQLKIASMQFIQNEY